MGQWIRNNSDIIDIGDLSKRVTTISSITINSSNSTNGTSNSSIVSNVSISTIAVFTFTKTCNYSGEEYYLLLTNKLAQSNEVNATLLPNGNSTIQESIVDTFCSLGGSDGKCSSNNTSRKGFSHYKTGYGDKLEFWLFCNSQNVGLNATLNITARFLNVIDVEEESSGLSGGGIAGIVIACIVVFLFSVGMLIKYKGLSWIINALKCCKNKTQDFPDESPRQPHDIERKETGLAGNQADG